MDTLPVALVTEPMSSVLLTMTMPVTGLECAQLRPWFIGVLSRATGGRDRQKKTRKQAGGKIKRSGRFSWCPVWCQYQH